MIAFRNCKMIFLTLIWIDYSWLKIASTSDYNCQDPSTTILGAGLFDQTYFQAMAMSYAVNRSISQGRSIQFSTDPLNSSYGQMRLENLIPGKTPVAYAITDLPLSAADQARYPSIVSIPLFPRSLVIVFNLPNITSLNLTLGIVAEAYLSSNFTWNDPSIAAINPGVQLPPAQVMTVCRADGGADTQVLTEGLSRNSNAWAQDYGIFTDPAFVGGVCCDSKAWPHGQDYFAQGMIGMAGLIASIPYSIGYMKRSQAVLYQIPSANMANTYGNFVSPTRAAIQAGMDYWAPRTNSVVYDLYGAPVPTAYPLLHFTVLMMYQVTPTGTVSCCAIEELVGFLYSLFTDDHYRSQAGNYGLVPLHMLTVQNTINNILSAVTCSSSPMLLSFEDTLVTPAPPLNSGGITAVTAGCIAFVIIVSIIIVVFQQQKSRAAEEKLWVVSSTKVVVLDQQSSKLQKSLGTISKSSKGSSMSTGTTLSTMAVKCPQNIAVIDELMFFLQAIDGAAEPRHWDRKLKRSVALYRREILHRNVLPFFGATLAKDKVCIVTEYAAKGTLHYVLRTTKYDLSDSIRYSIAVDIAEGMKFLHRKGIIHGFLSSITCYVDSSWTVRVGNWIDFTISKEEAKGYLHRQVAFSDTVEDERSLVRLLYLDTEICAAVEIFTGQMPYSQEVETGRAAYKDVLKEKYTKRKIPKPSIASLPSKLQRVVEDCFREAGKRYSFAEILDYLNAQRPSSKGIVDEMMATMENYTEQLELKVEERTQELTSVSKRMQELLHEVLPPQIAQRLFKGEAVEPELFDSASIYFSDIVGFTQISATSTPLQVMTFLNDLWVAFDTTIELFDVYKVDTIGDAYMVCSGLPVRNGLDHVKHICSLALALLRRCKTLKIRHMPNEQLQIRIGINTGTVIAGVVGTKMPQFCVFGDAVNTAARMESTGLPLKIQISEDTKAVLESNFREFRFELRGEIDVKGKGMMNTYWLIPLDDFVHPIMGATTALKINTK